MKQTEGRPLLATRARIASPIDLTSVVDVVFILLIFFMVAAKFARPAMNVELPGAAGKEVQTRGSVVLTIGLKRPGTAAYYVGRKHVEGDRLAAELKLAVQRNKIRAVLIRADRNVPFHSFVAALEKARASGAQTVEIEHKP